jgi:putative pyruvate formate lyase activating enzyme
LDSGELQKRARQATELLRECRVCPRHCRANRLEGEKGICRVGAEPVVSSFGPHFGEETPLVGRHGSGTIFFTDCNLRCVFCQNAEISHGAQGELTSVEALASMMLRLQHQGCHNINLVSPTHQVPAILSALAVAADGGLSIPIVYNTGGYDSVETLHLLDGVVDIYMPDCKYSDDPTAQRLSGIKDYWDRNREALAEMHRQVGDLVCDQQGVARRGLLVRHLVLPNGLAGTEKVMGFIASLSRETYVNIMAQYRPCYRAMEFPELSRPITAAEYAHALSAAREAGLGRFDERPRTIRAWL